jgi:hypothetical protein
VVAITSVIRIAIENLTRKISFLFLKTITFVEKKHDAVRFLLLFVVLGVLWMHKMYKIMHY